jgi:hypothetical protein
VFVFSRFVLPQRAVLYGIAVPERKKKTSRNNGPHKQTLDFISPFFYFYVTLFNFFWLTMPTERALAAPLLSAAPRRSAWRGPILRMDIFKKSRHEARMNDFY